MTVLGNQRAGGPGEQNALSRAPLSWAWCSVWMRVAAVVLATTVLGCGGGNQGPEVINGVPRARLQGRAISINGLPVGPEDAQALGQLEHNRRAELPDGDYWYDSTNGALGFWGGPTVEFVEPGIAFRAELPEHASGGGTGVFVNGRELHPEDHTRVSGLVGRSVPMGRYWMDAEGNVGPEGGGTLMNLFEELRRQGGSVPQLGAGVRGSK